MRNAIVIFIVIVLLAGLLASASFASQKGVGLVASGNPNSRSGSLGMPIILGGGPGSGK